MTTPPDRHEPTVALTVAPPRGLEVQVEREERGDGPFRVTALTRTVVGLRVDRSWRRPVGRFYWWPVAVGAASPFAAIAAFAMFGATALVWLSWFCFAVMVTGTATTLLTAKRIRRSRERRIALLAIEHETESLVLPGLPPIRLADIESIEIASRLEEYPPGRKITSHELRVHDVVITTPAGKLLVAITATEEQAGHVRDLIMAARRRLPGPE